MLIPNEMKDPDDSLATDVSLCAGAVRLMIASVAVALIWLAVLPWIAAQPAMRSHLDWLEDEGIDPSAMYYTELEVMDEILERQRRDRSRP